MIKTPVSVTATLFLILINAFIWLAFAIITATGLHPSIPESDLVRLTMSMLALLTSGLLIGLYFFLRRRTSVAYYITLGMLALISLLTVTDEFGLPDLVVLAISVVPFVLLIKDKAWYLQRNQANQERG